MKLSALVFSFLSLAACSTADQKDENSEIVRNQVGRYQPVAASDGFPPMVVDTAAGCVMALQKAEDGKVQIDEVAFPDGTNSCRVSKQLLVVETLSRVISK